MIFYCKFVYTIVINLFFKKNIMSEQIVQPVVEPQPTAAQQPTSPAQQAPVQNAPTKRKVSRILVFIVILLLLVAIVGAGVFIVIQNNNKKAESDISNVDDKNGSSNINNDTRLTDEESDSTSRDDIENRLEDATNEEEAMDELDSFFDEAFTSVDLPSGFPSDVPIFDKSGVYSVDEMQDSFDVQMRHVASNASIESVYDFYKKELETNGWSIRSDSKTSISFSLTAEKNNGDREVYVSGSDIIDIYVSLEVSK